jgi:hypothetical protein
VYYNEAGTSKYVPPTVLVDLLSPESRTPSAFVREVLVTTRYTMNDEGKASRNADMSHG